MLIKSWKVGIFSKDSIAIIIIIITSSIFGVVIQSRSQSLIIKKANIPQKY